MDQSHTRQLSPSTALTAGRRDSRRTQIMPPIVWSELLIYVIAITCFHTLITHHLREHFPPCLQCLATQVAFWPEHCRKQWVKRYCVCPGGALGRQPFATLWDFCLGRVQQLPTYSRELKHDSVSPVDLIEIPSPTHQVNIAVGWH